MSRFLLIILLLFAFEFPLIAQENASANRLAVRVVDGNGEFYDTVTNETFVPRGVNFIDWQLVSGRYRDYALATNHYDSDRLRTHFESLAERGYNTVRVFFDSCSDGLHCINNPAGDGLNPDYLDNIVDMMYVAMDTNIYLVLTSNDLPEGGYWEISNQGANSQFEGYRNAHYLTSPGVESAVQYWTDFMDALIERDAPTEALLGWSLLNEQWYFQNSPPLSLTEGILTTANGATYDISDDEQKRAMLVEGIAHYIETVSAVIRERDPETLITMGFFSPQFPNPTTIGGDWYVDTALLFELTTLDFFDFHAYPGSDIPLTAIAENFGMSAHPDRPVIMGEVGAFTHQYQTVDVAALALMDWIIASCTVGFDGWLFWDYFGAPPVIGDAAWGMLAEDSFMLDTFAPSNQPDPCIDVEIDIRNLALNRPVTSSSALPNEPAQNATNGNDAQWGAGADAPQWIMIDLESPQSINEITLRVAQYPEGYTQHQVWALLNDGRYILLEDFQQETRDDDILTVNLPTALDGVVGIRVDSLVSPSWISWKEVMVFGQQSDTPACIVTAPNGANLRADASTSSAIVGSLLSGSGAYITGQQIGDDGFVWWQLLHDAWLRSDVVNSEGDCASVPTTTQD